MLIVADTHVHIYTCYDLEVSLQQLLANLTARSAVAGGAAPGGAAPGKAVKLAFLTERYDCRFFRDLASSTLKLPNNDFKIQQTGEKEALLISCRNEPVLYLLAGRQIVSEERIEILSLTSDENIPDGLPARETIARIRSAGGLPVLSWAPGKWFFKRGRLVAQILAEAEAGSLFVGDTTLRPVIWREPGLMKIARQKGLKVIAGSDPLPFAGEERYMGRYASVFESNFDTGKPVSSARSLLRAGGGVREGKRSGVVELMARLYQNARSKKINVL